MAKSLPELKPRPREQVVIYISRALTNERRSDKTQLHELVDYEDGSYRAIFHPEYFISPEGQTEPTKSQWNTLKKHMKRLDRAVFIFKDHGETDCGDRKCYYIDFGFFAQRRD